MNKLQAKFLKILNEAPQRLDPEMERQAMEGTLDDGVSAQDFETDMEPDPMATGNEVADIIQSQNAQQKSAIASWTQQIATFNTYLTNQVQPMVKEPPAETVLYSLDGRAKSLISKVSADLAYIQQALEMASK